MIRQTPTTSKELQDQLDLRVGVPISGEVLLFIELLQRIEALEEEVKELEAQKK